MSRPCSPCIVEREREREAREAREAGTRQARIYNDIYRPALYLKKTKNRIPYHHVRHTKNNMLNTSLSHSTPRSIQRDDYHSTRRSSHHSYYYSRAIVFSCSATIVCFFSGTASGELGCRSRRIAWFFGSP